jgi:hypothetical protein
MALDAVSGLAVGDFLYAASLFVGDFCFISFNYGTLGCALTGCFVLYFNYKFARRLLIFYEGCFVADFAAPAPPVVVFFGFDFM